ncbi:hypothetical protein K2173_013334 [Erythroxylum novogranatense]|uniref:SET domain-containing protein n=1 Tax=Erythroxylum novogranatense TaxID=1862640 RepID=A0AAV8S9L5_9ROSI|nr:hypothetical protein K2173_013334 [Erythroxylum novogranatense]
MTGAEEEKLERFLQWLQVNRAELRGCKVKYCDRSKGFGLFSSGEVPEGVLLVVPLDLAITPMRVLQDPLIGPECRAMFEEGEVDDRFLIMLFLTLERLRKNSSWKPYLDMLPSTFGNPLWFTNDELSELKGTTLYQATEMQKKVLHSLFDDKVKGLVKKLLVLDGNMDSNVSFEDFLWGHSVFWSRALNIPLPHSFVFPQIQQEEDGENSVDKSVACDDNMLTGELSTRSNDKKFNISGVENQVKRVPYTSIQGETIWVEGLVPGIDFCNHDVKAVATWEVDGEGLITGIPSSMYLLSAEQTPLQVEKEISISYGNKGNEELLYLYGFVMENNPDDYLMVHYPTEAIQHVPFSESKMQLLEAQKAEMRCLLPKSLLDHGFFPPENPNKDCKIEEKADRFCNFSWSGHRKSPSYVKNLVFPEEFLTALRTITMQEDELYKVSSLLEELVGSEGKRQPTEAEVRAAVWEVCGDSGAFQLLVDLLHAKMMDIEEWSGTEQHDSELPEEGPELCRSNLELADSLSRNRWCSRVYRRGQKELIRLFLREAEHALQLSLSS